MIMKMADDRSRADVPPINTILTCIHYFYCHCDQLPDKKQLERGFIGSHCLMAFGEGSSLPWPRTVVPRAGGISSHICGSMLVFNWLTPFSYILSCVGPWLTKYYTYISRRSSLRQFLLQISSQKNLMTWNTKAIDRHFLMQLTLQ